MVAVLMSLPPAAVTTTKIGNTVKATAELGSLTTRLHCLGLQRPLPEPKYCTLLDQIRLFCFHQPGKQQCFVSIALYISIRHKVYLNETANIHIWFQVVYQQQETYRCRIIFDHPVAGELSCNALYFRFKKASEVCDFHFEISDLIFPKNVH